MWLRSLVENAVDALGGGRGVVRLTLKPTLTHVAIAVEDNGRGLGEDLYKKLGVQDPARLGLADVKAQAAKMGARLDLHSRLGVGTRATLELSRIDALSALTRASRESAPRTTALRTSQDSNSLHA
ncbi:MAG: ATP-binding protein [Bdellovibrionota bacterium]